MMSFSRVSSDRENREFAGKLNDAGKKKREIARNFAKKGKFGNFYSVILFLKKKNCEVRFCPSFFKEKTKPFF